MPRRWGASPAPSAALPRCRAGRRIWPARAHGPAGPAVLHSCDPPTRRSHEPSIRRRPRRPRKAVHHPTVRRLPRRRRGARRHGGDSAAGRRGRQPGAAGRARQAHLHPPLHRPGLAGGRPRRPRRRAARQQLLRQRHQLRLGPELDRRQHRPRSLVHLVPRLLVGHLPQRPLRRERAALRLLAPRVRPGRAQPHRHVQELLPQLAAERAELPDPGDRRQPDEGAGRRRHTTRSPTPRASTSTCSPTSAPTPRSCSSPSWRRR